MNDDWISTVLGATLSSPNEPRLGDGEAANVVDGLFAIARSLLAVATSIDYVRDAINRFPEIRAGE